MLGAILFLVVIVDTIITAFLLGKVRDFVTRLKALEVAQLAIPLASPTTPQPQTEGEGKSQPEIDIQDILALMNAGTPKNG